MGGEGREKMETDTERLEVNEKIASEGSRLVTTKRKKR